MFLKSKNDICFIILAKKWSNEKLPWFIMLLRLHPDVDDIREGNLYVTCIKGFGLGIGIFLKCIQIFFQSPFYKLHKDYPSLMSSTSERRRSKIINHGIL